MKAEQGIEDEDREIEHDKKQKRDVI